MSATSSDFIHDFVHFNSGNQTAVKFRLWTALSLINMAVGRRVFLDYSYFNLYLDSYVCLVGRQGLGKDTIMNEGFKIFKEACPEYPIGASVTSREKIVMRLCDDADTLRTFTDEHNSMVEWHPLAFFISELKNFVSFNSESMISFLIDIYNKKFFESDTVKRGLEPVKNPCLNILACENPPWVVNNLKANVLSGGFVRRMMFVYETEELPRITFPKIPDGGYPARDRCIQQLRDIQHVAGPFQWDSETTKSRFDKWNTTLQPTEDDLLRGFYQNRDCLVLKVAMALKLGRQPIELILDWPTIEEAILWIQSLADTLPKLTIAAGRNELAVPTQEMLDILEGKGGIMPKKLWHRESIKRMNDFEFAGVMKSLKETDQLFVIKHQEVEVVVLPWKYKELMKKGEIVTQKKELVKRDEPPQQ